MPYSYIEHISDIGIHAEGDTLAAAFESGVEAVLGVMFVLDTVDENVKVAIHASAPEIDLLFVEVINEVLSMQGRDGLALKRLETRALEKTDKGFIFTGIAHGETLNLDKHEVRTEVKGATYSGLRYYKGEGGRHCLECILDV